MVYRFKPAAELRNISLKPILPVEEITVFVDKEAVIKIISNLLTNALKYATSKVIVTLSIDAHASFFELAVADDGMGIEKEFHEKVFEPFYQIDGDGNIGKKTGTGIGLALAKQLAERHQGTIHLKENDLLSGAMFVLRIPLNQANEEAAIDLEDISLSDHDKHDHETISQANKMNLLIVEDNEELRKFLDRNLKQEFNVLTAENGAEAIEILNEHVVEIIISDIVMPLIGGLELVKIIKDDEQHSHIPIVLLSARTNVETKIKGMECGADCYIEKPFSIEFLKAQLNSLVRNRVFIQEKFAKSPFISYGSIANNKKDEGFINKLNDEIEKNLSDAEYSIEKLSVALSVSRSNLQRKIKGLAGMAPNDYIRVFRLKKSAQLLMNGEYRINEICFLVGFNSPSYFSKCFQKQFGALPKDFTKNIEQE
jgi:DNA-binding response OmpR family regulator